jgi:hypothetical protein
MKLDVKVVRLRLLLGQQAANDLLDVLEWHFRVFEDQSRPQQEITVTVIHASRSVKRGHLRLVKSLRSGTLYEEVEPATEAAAGKGGVQMVAALVSGHALLSGKPFVAAAANGHVQVQQLLVDRPHLVLWPFPSWQPRTTTLVYFDCQSNGSLSMVNARRNCERVQGAPDRKEGQGMVNAAKRRSLIAAVSFVSRAGVIFIKSGLR